MSAEARCAGGRSLRMGDATPKAEKVTFLKRGQGDFDAASLTYEPEFTPEPQEALELREKTELGVARCVKETACPR